MDVVYFYRPLPAGSGTNLSEELRYSLRSIEANLAGLGQVHVFGGRPAWLSSAVHHHSVSQGIHKHVNTWRIWAAIASAFADGSLPEWFVIMNDDYFVMRPIGPDVPAMHTGTLAAWGAARRLSSGIHDAVVRTAGVLESRGVPRDEQLSYELHVPFLAHGPTLAALWPQLDASGYGKLMRRVIKRSMLANLTPGMNATAEHLVSDVKIFGSQDPMHSGTFLSTSDLAFASRNVSRAGVEVRAAFPSPSRFEAATVRAPRLVRSS